MAYAPRMVARSLARRSCIAVSPAHASQKKSFGKKWLLLLTLLAASPVFAGETVVFSKICKVCEKNLIPADKTSGICNECQEEINKNTAALTNAILSGRADAKKKQASVDKAAARLAAVLSDKTITDSKKIQTVEALIKQVNAPEFYETVASYAPLAVVKYFWPDKNDEKVYLESKKALEANSVTPADRLAQATANFMETNDLKAFEEEHNKIQNQMAQQAMGQIFGTSKEDAPKKSRTAFALGRMKKDNSVRFVDPENFSMSILYAAIENPDLKVLQYFLDQIDGLDWEIRTRCMGKILQRQQSNQAERKEYSERLAEEEKNLKNADDKFDQEKYAKKVASLKKIIAGIPEEIEMDEAKAKLLFGGMTRFEFFYLQTIASKYLPIRGYWNETVFKSFLKLAEKFCSPQVAAWVKKYSPEDLTKWEKMKKDKEVFGKEVKGLWGNYSERPKGLIIKELPCLMYCQYHSDVRWGIGIPYPAKPGFVSGEEEGSFVWQAGVPDVTRVGFVSGAKEGEWGAAPGFKKSGDKMIWTPGAKHPTIEGLIAGKDIFSWIPDEEHLWTNADESDDLSVRKNTPVWVDFLKSNVH